MTNKVFQWAIIGAGPAGIAAVGKLLDAGVEAKAIAWIDPAFKGGDIAKRWSKVSSNTKVDLFLKYFTACKAFAYPLSSTKFLLNCADPTNTCLLELIVEPLKWVTANLMEQVECFKLKAQQLNFQEGNWEVNLGTTAIKAKKVVMAMGAEPKSLALPQVEEIPLEVALNPGKLKVHCQEDDVVAVFGSSHSAVIVLQNLLEESVVRKVINFYLAPLRYAVYYEDWILFDDTGLKGNAAIWAKENIDGKLPAKLDRFISNEENLQKVLPHCNRAVYATGFNRREIPVAGLEKLNYDQSMGQIAPGLFGLGIAFPEGKVDRNGVLELRVGLWKFMDYLNRVMPLWLSTSV